MRNDVVTVALAIASKYHGRPAEREFVLGEAMGGFVFVECAREAVKAIIEHFYEQAEASKFESDRCIYFGAVETLQDLLAEPVEQVPFVPSERPD